MPVSRRPLTGVPALTVCATVTSVGGARATAAATRPVMTPSTASPASTRTCAGPAMPPASTSPSTQRS